MAKHFSMKALRTVVLLEAQNFDRHGYVLFTHRAKRLPICTRYQAWLEWWTKLVEKFEQEQRHAIRRLQAYALLRCYEPFQQQHRQGSLSFLGSPPRGAPRILTTAHERAWTQHLRALYQLLSFIVFNEPGHNSKEQACGDSAHQHASKTLHRTQ